ncbi:MAG: hypothetical protein N2049_02120, partial [Anaerolineales bacterium]|nr:hypothetical protein [Anaerolineales bacterium]
PDNRLAQDAACFAIYNGNNVNFVFLSPINVKSSSISAFSTVSGSEAAGQWLHIRFYPVGNALGIDPQMARYATKICAVNIHLHCFLTHFEAVGMRLFSGVYLQPHKEQRYCWLPEGSFPIYVA